MIRILLRYGIGPCLAIIGLLTWTALSLSTGDSGGIQLREAWDTSTYFLLGLPVMALAVTAASFIAPSRAWRWPLWMAGGHQLGVLAAGAGMQSGLSLALLTIIVVLMLSTVLAIPAEAGSRLNRYVLTRA